MTMYEEMLNQFNNEQRNELKELGHFLRTNAPEIGCVAIEESTIVSMIVAGDSIERKYYKLMDQWNQDHNIITLDVYLIHQVAEEARYYVEDLFL